jgi:LEA14-like dessication related protein
VLKSVQTSEGNMIRIDRPVAVIPPNSRSEFLLTLDSLRQETLEEYFEIIVKNGG